MSKIIKIICYTLSFVLLVIAIAILVYTLPNHISEVRSMQECANTPGCMFCTPKWVGGKAIVNYSITFLMLLISFLLFFKGIKKKECTENV